VKAAWAVGIGLLVAAPIMALPTHWSAKQDDSFTRYTVGERRGHGSHVMIACRPGGGAEVEVAIDGGLSPAGSEIGFRAAGRTIVLNSGDDGLMRTDSPHNAHAFETLWQAVRSGDRLEISFTNGVSATLPLSGSTGALPPIACPTRYQA